MIKHVVVALLGLVIASTELAACGDKFLVPSRGLRFQLLPIDRESAAILLYVRQGSELDSGFTKLGVETALRKAGYRPVLARTNEELERALVRGGWDVVLLDLADGPLVSSMPPGVAPTVVPVAHQAPRGALDDAKKRYRQVLAAPTKVRAVLDAVDKAVAARTKPRARASTRSGA